jgi:hypothetical protein
MVIRNYLCSSQLKEDKMNRKAKNAADRMMFQLLASSPIIDKVKMQDLFDNSLHTDFDIKSDKLEYTKKNLLDTRYLKDELVDIWKVARASIVVTKKASRKAGRRKSNEEMKDLAIDTNEKTSVSLGLSLPVAPVEVMTKAQYIQIAADEAGIRYDKFKANVAIEFSKLMNVA